jgi:hypothetical protein
VNEGKKLELAMHPENQRIFYFRLMAWVILGLQLSSCTPSIKFTKPVAKFSKDTKVQLTVPAVRSPVEVCMYVKGYILAPTKQSLSKKKSAKKQVNVTVADPSLDDDDYDDDIRENLIDKSSGHYHLLIDIPKPKPDELKLHMKKDESHIPMVDGSKCKKLALSPGGHTIQAIFAYENHTPVNPVLTNSINFTVEE